jgi:hypothetical protein
MAKTTGNGLAALLDGLIERLVEDVSARLGSARKGGRGPAAAPKSRRRSKLSGKKLDMSCRVEGCKNRSMGPRNGFMCAEHMKLSKKDQLAARDAWKAKHSAA